MMPQLEEQPLYDKFKAGGAFEGQFRKDFAHRTGLQDSGIISSENGVSCPQLLQTQLQILACPSNSNSERLRTDQEELGVNWPIAVTDYKGVLDDTFLGQTFGGVMSNDASPYPSGAYIEPPPAYDSGATHDCHNNLRCRGIFFRQSYQRPVKISSVTDGTSKTLMIGEDLPEFNNHSAAFYANGDWCSCNIPINNLINLQPETLNLDFWWEQQGFRSRHPGGAQFCLADGSVRFVSDSIGSEAYRTSCSRNGNETTNESF
jgi:prepilin-type processing-associated H-X9-DG protein